MWLSSKRNNIRSPGERDAVLEMTCEEIIQRSAREQLICPWRFAEQIAATALRDLTAVVALQRKLVYNPGIKSIEQEQVRPARRRPTERPPSRRQNP